MKRFYFGSNVIIEKEIDKITQAFAKIDPDFFNLFKFSGAIESSKITDAVFSSPIFGAKKLILLHNLIPDNDKKILLNLIGQIKKTPDFSSIVWSESGLELEKNAVVKEIISSKVFDVKNCSVLSASGISNWLLNKAAAENLIFSRPAIARLIALTESDLEKIEAESEKIFLYTKANGKTEIDVESIDLLVRGNSNESIFKFLEAISRKDQKNAFISLNSLLQIGQNELYIISMLAYQFRLIYSIKELSSKGFSEAQIAKEIKAHPFVVKKNLSFARAFSFKQIEQNFFLFEDFDAKTKQGLIDPNLEIFLLVQKLC